METKIKFKTFGKTEVSKNKFMEAAKCLDSCKSSNCNKWKNQKEKYEELIDKRTKQIEEAVLKIKGIKQERAGKIFQMKKNIRGSNKSNEEAIAIRHPDTGGTIVNKNKS